MIEQDDIFYNGDYMLKTIPLEETGTIKSEERLCSTCGNYKGKLKCRLLGKIKNPNYPYCSWWKEKLDKKMETKICSDCKEIKTIDKFYKYKSSPDGHQSRCINCAIRYERERQGNGNGNKRDYRSLK